MVDYQFAETGAGQRFDVAPDQGLAGHPQQRLGSVIGEWSHSFAATGGK